MEGDGAMRSIDNLREYALTAASVNATTRAVLAGYVDEIEREVKDALLNVHTDLMDANGWMRYPVDADGVPIHVGDVMEGYQITIEVDGLCWDGESWSLVDACGTRWHDCAAFTHHHAPTVEDVLREFAAQVTNGQHIHGAIEIEQAIAECAAKLTLRGDE